MEFIFVQFSSLSEGLLSFSDSFTPFFGTGGKNIASLFIQIFQLFENNIAILLVLILFFIIIWLVISAQGALVRGVAESGILGKTSLRENFLYSSSRFFPLFGILLVSRFVALFIFAVVGLPLAALLMYFVNPVVSIFISVFTIGVPLVIFASMISKYAICYCLFENKKTSESLTMALLLFSNNWFVSIELAVALFVFNLLFGFFIILVVIFFSTPFILMMNLFSESHYLLSLISGVIGEIVSFVVLIILGSVLATFQYGSWVEMFLRIRKRKYLSKLMRSLIFLKEKYR